MRMITAVGDLNTSTHKVYKSNVFVIYKVKVTKKSTTT